RPDVGVEVGETGVGVEGQGDAESGLLVDAQHAGVLRLREDGVAADVAVVLVGDPGLVGDVGVCHDLQQRCAHALGGVVPVEVLRTIGGRRVEVGRTLVGTVVDGALVRDRLRVDVDDDLVVPGDDQPVAVGDLADDRGQYVPLAADLHEALDVGR